MIMYFDLGYINVIWSDFLILLYNEGVASPCALPLKR
jgi:hypothetical protein